MVWSWPSCVSNARDCFPEVTAPTHCHCDNSASGKLFRALTVASSVGKPWDKPVASKGLNKRAGSCPSGSTGAGASLAFEVPHRLRACSASSWVCSCRLNSLALPTESGVLTALTTKALTRACGVCCAKVCQANKRLGRLPRQSRLSSSWVSLLFGEMLTHAGQSCPEGWRMACKAATRCWC